MFIFIESVQSTYQGEPIEYEVCDREPRHNSFGRWKIYGRYYAYKKRVEFKNNACEDYGLLTPWIETEDDFKVYKAFGGTDAHNIIHLPYSINMS